MLSVPGGLYGFAADGYWVDIGTPDKYLEAHDDALAGRLGAPPAPGAREVAPGVWMQGDVDVDPSAEIVAPVLLGPGARVEKGARVHASVVGAATVVEANAVLERAVLHERVRVAAGARVQTSIVGPDAVLEADCTLEAEAIIGAGVTIVRGSHLAGDRVPS
jgi:NDP-sugar pyrophosphorylase family protein